MQFSILFAVTALLAAAVSAAPAENAQAAEAAANRCGSFCFQKGHKCSGGMVSRLRGIENLVYVANILCSISKRFV